MGVCEVWDVSTTQRASDTHRDPSASYNEIKFSLNLDFTSPLMWSLAWLNNGKTDS